jgi:phage-related protein
LSAPTPWQSGTAHSVGDVVQAFTDPGTGFFFRCVVAGTTGSSEPFWPSFIGNEAVDGTVTWKAVSIISGDFQAPDPSAIIELFELQLFANIHGVNDIYRFHAGTNLVNNGEVVWKGNPYLRFPVEADGFEYTGQGALPRPKIRISNILGSITAILLSMPNGLEAAKITRIRTLGRYLDAANFPVSGDILLTEDSDALLLEDSGTILLEPINPTEDFSAEFPREIYYIDRKSAENREIVEFELASVFDLAGVRAPKRQCIANICQWVYRSAECGYTPVSNFSGTYSSTARSLTVTATSHGLTVGKSVWLEFSSGSAISGPYTVTTATSGSFVVVLSTQKGVYSRSGTTVTVNITEHGYVNGDVIAVEFRSGDAASGSYTIANVTTNSFTVTTVASGTTEGSVEIFYPPTNGNVAATQYFNANNTAVFVANDDVCGKRLSSCQIRFGADAELPYGSFPGVGSAAS